MKAIKLSPEEMKCLRIMAEWRSRGKEKLKSASGMAKTSLEGHLIGIAGEFAVAKEMGGFFDPMPHMQGDRHAADVIVGFRSRMRIAVKTTKYNPPIFKINSLREIQDATHVALCMYQLGNVIEMHWILSVDRFMNEAYEKDFGYGIRKCLGVRA